MSARLLRILQSIWAGPLTLCGLALIASGGRLLGVRDGARIYVAESGVALRFLWRFGFAAVGWGEVVLLASENLLGTPTLRHELEHVAQARRWGILLWPLYGASSIAAVAAGLDWHDANAFEIAARRAAGQRE